VKIFTRLSERQSNQAIDLLGRIRRHKDDIAANKLAIERLNLDNWDLQMSIHKLGEQLEKLQEGESDEAHSDH